MTDAAPDAETGMERLREITEGRNLEPEPPPKKPVVAEVPVNSFMGEAEATPPYEPCGRPGSATCPSATGGHAAGAS
jgi:hypothetical protein